MGKFNKERTLEEVLFRIDNLQMSLHEMYEEALGLTEVTDLRDYLQDGKQHIEKADKRLWSLILEVQSATKETEETDDSLVRYF